MISKSSIIKAKPMKLQMLYLGFLKETKIKKTNYILKTL